MIFCFNLHCSITEPVREKRAQSNSSEEPDSKVKLMIITGRNEVLAKVIFSQACVCPQGGVPAPNFRGGACS